MQVSIKTFAKRAKHRLASGFWDDIRKEREKNILKSDENGAQIRDNYAKRLMHSLYNPNENSDDIVLYKKVCKLLSNDEFYINPIGQLIDHKKYDNMNSESKQMYIIKLTDKYNEMRERFKREHSQ